MSRALPAMDAKVTRSNEMHGTMHPRPAGAGNGAENKGHVLSATGSQPNVISPRPLRQFAREAERPTSTLIAHRNVSCNAGGSSGRAGSRF